MIEELLDWFVELDFQSYRTQKTDIYNPSGKSHFYLKGSSDRFTSGELLSIWFWKMGQPIQDLLKERFQESVKEHQKWCIMNSIDFNHQLYDIGK